MIASSAEWDVYTGSLARTHTRCPSRRLGGKRHRIQLSPLPDALKINRTLLVVLTLALVVGTLRRTRNDRFLG